MSILLSMEGYGFMMICYTLVNVLVLRAGDISTMEKEWKTEFHEWKTRYIVDWKNQFDSFVNNYENRMKTCSVP